MPKKPDAFERIATERQIDGKDTHYLGWYVARADAAYLLRRHHAKIERMVRNLWRDRRMTTASRDQVLAKLKAMRR